MLDCHVCDNKVDGEKVVSCNVFEERLEDGAFTVLTGEPLMTVCLDCYSQYSIDDEIKSQVLKHIDSFGSSEPRQCHESVQNSSYSCHACAKGIPDGDIQLSIELAEEVWRGSIISPLKSETIGVVCTDCKSFNDLRNEVCSIIDSEIARSRDLVLS